MVPDGEDNRSDGNTRDRIDEIKEEVVTEQRAISNHLIRVTSIILGVLVVVQLGLGIWSLVLTNRQGDQNDRVRKQSEQIAAQSKQIADQNKQLAILVQGIQDSREEECRQQNERHDGSIDALRKGSNEDIRNAPNAAAKKEVRRRRDVTISLLDALAPHQDCDALVKGK